MQPDVPRLSYVTQFALAFIAFSAGAELYLPELRSLFKRILYSTTCVTLPVHQARGACPLQWRRLARATASRRLAASHPRKHRHHRLLTLTNPHAAA